MDIPWVFLSLSMIGLLVFLVSSLDILLLVHLYAVQPEELRPLPNQTEP